MGVMFSFVMLIGAVINGLLNGFSPLNCVYIALPAILSGYCFFISRKGNLRVTVGKLQLGASLTGFIVFGVLMILASKTMATENQFTYSDRLNDSARLISRGAVEDARKTLEKLNEKDPANPQVNLNLGVVYLKERKTDLVRQHLDAAGQRMAFDENLWFNYGIMYFQLKDYKNAQGCFEKALQLNPDMTSAAVYAGTMSFRLRELQRSIYHLENARFQKSDSPDILLHLGRAHMELMNFASAEEAFSTALQMKPSPALATSINEQLAALKAARGGITP